MQSLLLICKWLFSLSVLLLLTACAHHSASGQGSESDYAARLPQYIETNGHKMVLVDPNVHAWGAYGANGHLIRAGIATSGDPVCPPDGNGEDCRTAFGTFRITSLGGEDCASSIYPKPDGGGLMPYCMHFHDGQALHGSPDDIVIEDNVSHGCVRMRIPDAEWMRYNFAQVGTKVVVVPYH